jgi:hypothetical protein
VCATVGSGASLVQPLSFCGCRCERLRSLRFQLSQRFTFKGKLTYQSKSRIGSKTLSELGERELMLSDWRQVSKCLASCANLVFRSSKEARYLCNRHPAGPRISQKKEVGLGPVLAIVLNVRHGWAPARKRPNYCSFVVDRLPMLTFWIFPRFVIEGLAYPHANWRLPDRRSLQTMSSDAWSM